MVTTLDSVRALARKHGQHAPVAEHYNTEGVFRVGAGLYLRVQPSKKGGLLKNWIHRYQFAGKPAWRSLGSAYRVTEVDAAAAVDAGRDGRCLRS